MIIREMKKSDVPEIAKLETICFSDPWSENSIASELNNRLAFWLVAEERGAVVGYVGSQAVLDSADMMNLAVSPEFRRKGVGKLLVENLIACLQQQSIRFLLLEVRVSNIPAVSLYEKMGFIQVGKRPRYYHNPREDALILRKELSE